MHMNGYTYRLRLSITDKLGACCMNAHLFEAALNTSTAPCVVCMHTPIIGQTCIYICDNAIQLKHDIVRACNCNVLCI